MIKKREAELRKAFHAHLPPGLLRVVSHQHVRESGHPDVHISGNGIVSFLEYKHATPDFDCSGIQLLECLRENQHSFCRYILWWESADGRNPKTMVVHPREIKLSRDAGRWTFRAEAETAGFDHRWLAKYILARHGL